MDAPRKQQVSLRGASAKEITRDALLQKVSQERELRNYAKRAAAAALFIQSMEAVQGHKDSFFATSATVGDSGTSLSWCDDSKLDFRQFAETISILYYPYLNSASKGPLQESRFHETVLYDPIGKPEIFCECHSGAHDITIVTSLAMRVLVMLTDLKGWKGITNDNLFDADLAVEDLIQFMGGKKSGCYVSIGRYISALENHSSLSKTTQADENFFITASAITLGVRPFYLTNYDAEVPKTQDFNDAAEQYIIYLLTIPWLVKHLPLVLLPALKHKSILFPCFQTLLEHLSDVYLDAAFQ
ncbi:unnamed protein product [Sphenostylis stenocarpa]|uniref:HECT-type E3 ubiquitin transferase n=1 Tax=Sphenostylis stenocarpa TaxID=92480 RepID=A0AA86VW60_9FABA|nr:unnamed protein product [Sphenostylis stenocarpa]